MKVWKAMATAVPAIALLAATVWAAPPAAGQKGGVCAPDVEKFCKDVEPRGGGLRKCLEEHKADLSPACKDHVDKVAARAAKRREENQARREARHKACKDDIAKFCKDVRGGGKVRDCLNQHVSELSDACKTELANRPRRGQTPPAK
jgi:hypothetical protein